MGKIDITDIKILKREDCINHWRHLFGHSPPKHSSTQFLRRALAYEVQIKQYGGHSSAVKKCLKAPSKRLQTQLGKPSTLDIRTGSHLVREWNGRSYQIEVLDKGFRLDGKNYRSLTAIAKKITGAHWSGPRFFGLDH